ncbi:MAG: glycoside hydrolase family 3 protein [Clostridia bacterium]|nr:glycoside hydrolase family 3 protein [Clostridia bacterium]
MKRILALLLAFLMLAGCTNVEATTPTTTAQPEETTTKNVEITIEEPTTAPTEAEKTKAEKLLEGMTLREKVGQMFIVRPETLGGNHTGYDENMSLALKEYPVGGVVLFGQNLDTPDALISFTNQLRKHSLFVAIDEEGGTVSRIAKNDNFKVQAFHSMGDIEGESAAHYVGKTIGTYLKKYGVNLDFAPVSDVNSNPDNPVIGKRAFSNDPETVSKMVSNALDGFHEAGVMATIKHFLGHGDTANDTHTGYVRLDKSWDELKECELIPFADNFSKTDMVMASHITLPEVTSDGLPASLSCEIITDKLRNEMGYDGVIITDSMEMGAITRAYGAESAAMAVKAGCDIVLMPLYFEESFEAVLKAVENGEISEDQINASVLRILTLKEKYGII